LFEVTYSNILGLLQIHPSIHEDYRGSFVELFNGKVFGEAAPGVNFVRDAISTSTRHVLRGLHYDRKTWKLIQCLAGQIYFVVVDLRKNSTTYREWEAYTLNDHSRQQILVPAGCANGHLVLSESCIFHYKLSEHYDPANEHVLAYNDPVIGIHWPDHHPILSARDQKAVRELVKE